MKISCDIPVRHGHLFTHSCTLRGYYLLNEWKFHLIFLWDMVTGSHIHVHLGGIICLMNENFTWYSCEAKHGHLFTHSCIEVYSVVQDAYKRVVEFFGENPRTCSPTSFFSQFVRFVASFKVRTPSMGRLKCSLCWEFVSAYWKLCTYKGKGRQETPTFK